MNTLKFYPKIFREMYESNIKNAGVKVPAEVYHNSILRHVVFLTIIFSSILYYFGINLLYSLLVFVLLNTFFYFNISLKASSRIKKMETVFPDVISLMASNLRSGITIDRAFLLSARPEFHPLDQEILKAGKEITTGTEIVYALKTMSERIDSEKISKIITLIISGLKTGGNISDLLEQTSKNMKEKEVIEKKAASNIVMYTIFIFFAVGVGSPVLFGLSSVLVEIVLNLTSRLPDLGASNLDLPFTLSNISISPIFITYFSVLFIITTDLISSLVIGLVNKGEGKAGLRLFIPLVILSLSLFFIVKFFLSKSLLEAISVL